MIRFGNENRNTFWVWLSLACGVASREFGRLASRYEPYELFSMNEEEIERIDGIGERLKRRLCNKNIEEAEKILAICEENGIDLISYADPRYPSRLRNIEDPPAVLYVLGELPSIENRPAIGVVGTRKMSEYGKTTAFDLSYELALAGVVIVSGLALGVDAVAACGALAAKGKTVAVLGCGVLVDYPKAHRTLKRAILRHGALVSEYPPYEPAVPRNFPTRNRIISGMCQGTLLVEGALGSGSMITARLAIAQGRQLFTVPGKVGEKGSEGPNALIREGAYVVLDSQDILKHFEFLYREVLDFDALKQRRERPDCDAALSYFGVPADYEIGRLGGRKPPMTREPIATAEPSPQLAPKPKSPSKPKKAAPPPERDAKTPSPSVPLTAAEQAVLDRMPMDRPISPDALCADGIEIGEVLTVLTMLEIYGVVTSLPGGLYLRK